MAHFMLPEFQLNEKKEKLSHFICALYKNWQQARFDQRGGICQLCLKDASIILDTHVELN